MAASAMVYDYLQFCEACASQVSCLYYSRCRVVSMLARLTSTHNLPPAEANPRREKVSGDTPIGVNLSTAVIPSLRSRASSERSEGSLAGPRADPSLRSG